MSETGNKFFFAIFFMFAQKPLDFFGYFSYNSRPQTLRGLELRLWVLGLRSLKTKQGWRLSGARLTFLIMSTQYITVYYLILSSRYFLHRSQWFYILGYVIKHQLWRVWSWLRVNAGGVPNTCKSNDDWRACSSWLVAHGWVMHR